MGYEDFCLLPSAFRHLPYAHRPVTILKDTLRQIKDMPQDMLASLALPLLFSLLAGSYIFTQFPERRPHSLLAVTLIQLVGAFGYHQQPSAGLFGLLAVHSTVVFFQLLHHFQAPAPSHAEP